MACVDWSIRGPTLNNCNCNFGCPCQFNALPTHGNCEAITVGRIDEGHFGEVKLDGLCWVNVYKWPGAVHEGNGRHLSIIDERADEKQRHALGEILYGRESEDGANVFQVFGSTMIEMLDPVFAPIEFECDIAARTAKASVPGLIESNAQPIRNAVTGEEARVGITQPEGFEFHEAEVGSGTSRSTAAVSVELKDSHCHFTMYHMTHAGVVG